MPSVNPSTFTFSSCQLKPSALLGTASGRTGSDVCARTSFSRFGVDGGGAVEGPPAGNVAFASSGDERTSSILTPGKSCERTFSSFAERCSTLDKYLDNN